VGSARPQPPPPGCRRPATWGESSSMRAGGDRHGVAPGKRQARHSVESARYRRLSGTTEQPWTAEVRAIASSRRAQTRRSVPTPRTTTPDGLRSRERAWDRTGHTERRRPNDSAAGGDAAPGRHLRDGSLGAGCAQRVVSEVLSSLRARTRQATSASVMVPSGSSVGLKMVISMPTTRPSSMAIRSTVSSSAQLSPSGSR